MCVRKLSSGTAHRKVLLDHITYGIVGRNKKVTSAVL